jgi:hypothetical protein
VNCPPFPISLSFWVELVGACNSIDLSNKIIIKKNQFGTRPTELLIFILGHTYLPSLGIFSSYP